MTTENSTNPDYIMSTVMDAKIQLHRATKAHLGKQALDIATFVALIEIASEAISAYNELEKAHYEHGKTAEQSHRFSGRLGRINRMLDEAGIAPEGNADERLAKMLNRELPDYP